MVSPHRSHLTSSNSLSLSTLSTSSCLDSSICCRRSKELFMCNRLTYRSEASFSSLSRSGPLCNYSSTARHSGKSINAYRNCLRTSGVHDCKNSLGFALIWPKGSSINLGWRQGDYYCCIYWDNEAFSEELCELIDSKADRSFRCGGSGCYGIGMGGC